MTVETDFGTVTVEAGAVSIEADGSRLYDWANRTGAHWPCSRLADLDWISCAFDAQGLFDIESNLSREEWDDVGPDADEFNAWSSDVLRRILTVAHPCHFITVGQFEAVAR